MNVIKAPVVRMQSWKSLDRPATQPSACTFIPAVVSRNVQGRPISRVGLNRLIFLGFGGRFRLPLSSRLVCRSRLGGSAGGAGQFHIAAGGSRGLSMICCRKPAVKGTVACIIK
jgi:hypothetical protein